MFIPFSFPDIASVSCYFQIRSNIEDMSDNISFECGLDEECALYARHALFDALSIEQYCEVHQVHGTDTIYSPIIYDAKSRAEILQEGDGIATDKVGLALLIKTADCQPVLITDMCGKYIMALHVGWRGNARHYIQKAIAEFCAVYTIPVESLCAVRGPSLSPMKSQFIHAESEFNKDDLVYYDYEHSTMDLWAMTQGQLMEAGIPKEHIYSVDICTLSSPFLFSYRRNPCTGRQASIIVIRTI